MFGRDLVYTETVAPWIKSCPALYRARVDRSWARNGRADLLPSCLASGEEPPRRPVTTRPLMTLRLFFARSSIAALQKHLKRGLNAPA